MDDRAAKAALAGVEVSAEPQDARTAAARTTREFPRVVRRSRKTRFAVDNNSDESIIAAFVVAVG